MHNVLSLSRFMAEQDPRETTKRQGLLSDMKTRKLWRATFVNVLKGHGK